MNKLVIKNYPFTLIVYTPRSEPLHAINSLGIIFVLEGSMKMETIRKQRVLGKGELEFINVGELISCEKNTKKTIVARLEIDVEFVKNVIPDINNRVFNCKMSSFYKGRASEESYEELKYKTESIIAEMFFHSVSTGKSTISANKLLDFFQNEFEDIKNALKNVDKTIHQERFIRIDHYLMANISQQISLGDINDIEFISRPHLSKEFSRLLNRNFKEILSYYRVIYASKLLLETSLSVLEISLKSGFSSARYFYKYFKVFLDMTPNDFRNYHMNKSFKYEKIFEREKILIKKAISELAGTKTHVEEIVVNEWISTSTDTFGMEFNLELNVIVKHLKQKIYLYNLLKILEKISISTCRFIFTPSDISKFSVSDVYDILVFIFNNFNVHFCVCLSLDFSDISAGTYNSLLENWKSKVAKCSKKIDNDIHLNILVDSNDMKIDLERLFPKLKVILKSSLVQKTTGINLADLTSYINNSIKSKINLFINPKDVASIKVNPDTSIVLLTNQFSETSYFNTIYMFSLLEGSIVSKNDSLMSNNSPVDYAVCSLHHSDYNLLLYNLDNDNKKSIKIIIKTTKKCDIDGSILTFDSNLKNTAQTLLYQRTNICGNNMKKSSFFKNIMNVNTCTVTSETPINGNQTFVVTLEPGDIIVVNIPNSTNLEIFNYAG